MEHKHSFISFTVKSPLDKQDVSKWKTLLAKIGPRDVIGTASVTVGGEIKTSDFYVVKCKGGYEYVTPLARDLTEDEAGMLAVGWSRLYDNDFELDFSQTQQARQRKKAIRDRVVTELSEEIAKRLHSQWLDEKVSRRWNYGPRYSKTMRQHPMLLPWEQLPEKLRSAERDRVSKMFDILESVNLRLIMI